MRFRLVVNGEAHEVAADGGRVIVDGTLIRGTAETEGAGVTVRIGRKRIRILLTRWGAVVNDLPYRLDIHDLDLGDIAGERHGARAAAIGRVDVQPPMPGRIVRVAVREGERVPRHRPLVVLEAMKMQNEIPAPVAGIVREIRVREGESVLASDVLVVLEPE